MVFARFSPIVWGGILLLFISVVVVVAYGSNSPSIMGHSPDEIQYDFITEQNDATMVADCTASSSTSCAVQCPTDPSNFFKYYPVSGSCITANGLNVSSIGINGSGSSMSSVWGCRDFSHVAGKLFRASVVCLKGGI